MATPEEILNRLTNLQYAIDTLPERLRVSAGQIVIVTGLSELSEDLGMVMAGEFRAGNRQAPSQGFSGMRMAYPALTYNSELWNLVGVNNDVLQFGVNAANGKLYAGGGSVIMDAEGLYIVGEGSSDYNKRYRLQYEQAGAFYDMGAFYADYADTGGFMTVYVRAFGTSDLPWASGRVILEAWDGVSGEIPRVEANSNGTVGIGGATFSVDVGTSILLQAPLIRVNNTLQFTETSTPATPAGGLGALYVKLDGNLYFKNDAGTEYQLTPVPST